MPARVVSKAARFYRVGLRRTHADLLPCGPQLVKTPASPDLWVIAVGGTSEETVVDTEDHGYAYGPGWYYGGAPMSSRTTVTRYTRYTRGTLVVDLADARTKRLVWRGTAADILSEDPAVNAEKVHIAVRETFSRYPPSTQE